MEKRPVEGRRRLVPKRPLQKAPARVAGGAKVTTAQGARVFYSYTERPTRKQSIDFVSLDGTKTTLIEPFEFSSEDVPSPFLDSTVLERKQMAASERARTR